MRIFHVECCIVLLICFTTYRSRAVVLCGIGAGRGTWLPKRPSRVGCCHGNVGGMFKSGNGVGGTGRREEVRDVV